MAARAPVVQSAGRRATATATGRIQRRVGTAARLPGDAANAVQRFPIRFHGPSSARGSFGRPSTCSPMMFRCTWLVPA